MLGSPAAQRQQRDPILIQEARFAVQESIVASEAQAEMPNVASIPTTMSKVSPAERFVRARGITKNPNGPLSARQERFCTNYFETSNAVEAYRRAYGTRAQRSTVGPKAYRLLAEPKIRGRVQELRDRAADDAVVSVALILQELKRIALFDPRSIIGDNGTVLALDEMPPEAAAAIASIEVAEQCEGEKSDGVWTGRTTKVRFWNKVEALDKAMKYLGLFERNHRQKKGLFDGIPHSVLRVLEKELAKMVERDQQCHGVATQPG